MPGTLTVTPATGNAQTVSTFTTSGVCADGDSVRVKVMEIDKQGRVRLTMRQVDA